MQLIQASNGTLLRQAIDTSHQSAFTTGLSPFDSLLPPGGFRFGAVHELLIDGDCPPWCFAALLAHCALNEKQRGVIVWSDPRGELYPPAIASMLSIDRLFILRIGDSANELAALCECLRCKGVVTTIASLNRLSQIQVRRLQLAAEAGNGAAIFIRQKKFASIYAATTRWRVQPATGDARVQRWNVQLVHGHGGLIGKSVVLEVPRDTIDSNLVRAIDPMAHRPDQPQTTRASA